MHSASAWHHQKGASLRASPVLGSAGAATSNSTAPRAVLPAIALHQPPLPLGLRLPELPWAKYNINYDKIRLVMTLFFFQAPLCLPHLKESMDGFSPGTSLCLRSPVAAPALRSALWKAVVLLYVFAHVVLAESNHLNEKIGSVIPSTLGGNKRNC